MPNKLIRAVSHRPLLLPRWTAAMTLAEILVTWPLWTLNSQFPAIPFFRWLVSAPLALDWLGLAILLVGLLLVVAGRTHTQVLGHAMALGGGLLVVALNQHRLQPWFYLSLLFSSVLLLGGPNERARKMLQALVVSVYIFSALGKFDYEFLHTVGPMFLRGAVELLHLDGQWVESAPVGVVALLPLFELTIGVGLALPATRAWAAWAATAFHVLLMLVLGPLGLDHSWAVLLWNLQFAAQSPMLFRSSVAWPAVDELTIDARAVTPARSAAAGWRIVVACGIVSAAIALPATERWGYWDHWLSWALYAPHSSRCEVWIATTAVNEMPESLRKANAMAAEGELWQPISLSRWSLEQTYAPIYPQARFELGVAQAIAQAMQSPFTIRAVIRGQADRITGRRETHELLGREKIAQARDRFWLNTQAR